VLVHNSLVVKEYLVKANLRHAGALAWRREPVCARNYARVLVPPNIYLHLHT